MRLIDADTLRASVLEWENCYNGFSDTYDKARIIDAIDEQPTIDAEPVRRGEWLVTPYTDYDDTYECSVCGHGWEFIEGTPKENGANYCPNCGAKMEGME